MPVQSIDLFQRFDHTPDTFRSINHLTFSIIHTIQFNWLWSFALHRLWFDSLPSRYQTSTIFHIWQCIHLYCSWGPINSSDIRSTQPLDFHVSITTFKSFLTGLSSIVSTAYDPSTNFLLLAIRIPHQWASDPFTTIHPEFIDCYLLSTVGIYQYSVASLFIHLSTTATAARPASSPPTLQIFTTRA